jgi:hypothetical protein
MVTCLRLVREASLWRRAQSSDWRRGLPRGRRARIDTDNILGSCGATLLWLGAPGSRRAQLGLETTMGLSEIMAEDSARIALPIAGEEPVDDKIRLPDVPRRGGGRRA